MKYLNVLLIVCAATAVHARVRVPKTREGNSSQWQVIRDNNYRSGLATPCPGQTIPEGKSRFVKNVALGCTGASKSDYTRQPEPIQNYNEWYALEQIGDRAGMQQVRQQNSNVSWDGKLAYGTVINWNWIARMSGENSRECGYRKVSAICTREDRRSRQVRRCHEVYDPPSGGGGGYGGGGGSGGGSSGGGSSGGESEGDSPFGYNDSDKESIFDRVGIGILEAISPISTAHAREVCGNETEYYTVDVDYSCIDRYARSCEWEDQRSDSFHCQNQEVTYTATMAKPGADWGPNHSDYYDILPNKYDLLPGEWEKFTTTLQASGNHIAVGINDPENAWNTYTAQVSPAGLTCQLNAKHQVEIAIHTQGRIKRRGPNPLMMPDNNKALYFTEITVGEDHELVPIRPYEIRLQDPSAKIIDAAARQSRRFSESLESTEATSSQTTAGTFKSNGFWKDTQFRVRLSRIEPSFWKRDIRWTQNLYTTADLISVSRGNLVIPLNGGVDIPNFFRPSGSPLFLGGEGFGDIQLTPGKDYEMRVAVYQRGLKFYDSGCEDEGAICEGEGANDKAFSDELLIKFTAHPRIDDRSTWEKLLDFQRSIAR